jgi:hypothetical protein
VSGHHDDDAAPVEFLVITDVSADDELLEPARQPRSPLLRRATAAGAVVVLGGALVLRTATSNDTHRRAEPQPTVSSPASLQERLEALGAGGLSHANIPGLADCLTLMCSINSDLPLTFLAAVRERLGRVVVTKQIDITTGDEARTWYRKLNATGSGGITMIVTVSKALVSRVTTTSLKLTSDSVTAYVNHPTGDTGYSVQIQVTGPVTWTPPQDAMAALASDPRLVAGG